MACDLKRVLDDVRILIELGFIEKTPDDKIVCPSVDMHLAVAVAVAVV